jgi:glutamate synthase domain-containing protein 3
VGKKATHDYSPRYRVAIFRALQQVAKQNGRTLSQQFAVWMEEDWKKVLEFAAKIAPREAKVQGSISHDHRHTHESLQETDEFLRTVLERAEPAKKLAKH